MIYQEAPLGANLRLFRSSCGDFLVPPSLLLMAGAVVRNQLIPESACGLSQYTHMQMPHLASAAGEVALH